MALSFDVSKDVQEKVIAIAYHTGGKGRYAATIRNMVHNGIQKHLGALNEQERKEFDQILETVRRGEAWEVNDGMMSFSTSEDMRFAMIAIAYQLGASGFYGVPLRKFLRDGIKEYLRGLDERKRKEFEEILENVKIIKGAG